MKKTIAISSVALIILAFGLVAVGPFLTIYAIKDSLSTPDAKNISKYVNFPVLRQNIKGQLGTVLSDRMSDALGNNPLGAVVSGFSANLADHIVESFVTPAGLRALMSGRDPASIDTTDDTTGENQELSSTSFNYDSHDQFSIYFDGYNGKQVRIVLEREGLDWQLTNILPLN
ncbi:MAG: hypothetical protein CMN58_04105 [Solibacterales bacterium]|nr:hypothetical protein [Bryobacterales bacterium]|tara:strand:+ start:11282 stop:11800 length:519 start_codon:yes stop_codon:yes gene_type:complete